MTSAPQPMMLEQPMVGATTRSAARVAGRVLDCTLACALLVASAPLMLIAALAIWLDDAGPVLYRQTRIGWRGEPFQLLKLRSMRVDAEADGIARWAVCGDERTTRIGRFLRRTRLDEVPQLLNVLRGDMRIVGPRPERPCFVTTLSEQLPRYAQRHAVKPGITGWAQVRCGYAASIADSVVKLEHDLYYIEHRSLGLDASILLQTVAVVLTARGAR